MNKNVREIQDMNKLSKNVGHGSSHFGYGHNSYRGRRGYSRYPRGKVTAEGMLSLWSIHMPI